MNPARPDILATLLLLVLAAGCAGSFKSPEVILPGASAQLGDDEGFVIIQIDTDVPLEQVRFSSGAIANALPKGQHLWIVRLPAKRYAWHRIVLSDQAGVAAKHRLSNVALIRDDEFEFDVLPGTINYPGELIVRTDDYSRSSGWLWVRNRNHSAIAIRRLRETHAALLDAYPIRHVGWSEDGFLEFYAKQRRALAAEE